MVQIFSHYVNQTSAGIARQNDSSFYTKYLQKKPQRSEAHDKTEGRWADSSNETKQSHNKVKSAGQKVCTLEDRLLVDPYGIQS